jgi:crossover junction endodeoxyribonuclease RuvC
MRIISIDPGYDRVGIAILEKDKKDKKEKVIFSESFITNKKDKINDRIFKIGKRVNNLIIEYKPEKLIIESLFFSKNTKTALAVAEARGVIIFQAKRNNIEVFEYTPNQIKLAVAGHGSANKKDIFYMVHKLINISNKKRLDDELDAIAIGLTFFASYKNINM